MMSKGYDTYSPDLSYSRTKFYHQMMSRVYERGVEGDVVDCNSGTRT